MKFRITLSTLLFCWLCALSTAISAYAFYDLYKTTGQVEYVYLTVLESHRVENQVNFKQIAKDEALSIADNVSTLADGELNAEDAFAAIDLVTGFGSEAKKASKALGLTEDAVGAAKTSTSLVKTGTQFSKHSLERLAQRGVTPKMAETAINKGLKFYDPKNGSINYVLQNGFASGKSLLVGTNPLTGQVTTVIRSSKNLMNSRFIPIK